MFDKETKVRVVLVGISYWVVGVDEDELIAGKTGSNRLFIVSMSSSLGLVYSPWLQLYHPLGVLACLLLCFTF